MNNERKRPCRSCGDDLNKWGDRRGDCPNCAKAKRETVVPCAGRCGKSYEIRFMEAVFITFNPGKKGGKKFKIFYCSRCAASAKSKTRTMAEAQDKRIKGTEAKCKEGRIERESL